MSEEINETGNVGEEVADTADVTETPVDTENSGDVTETNTETTENEQGVQETESTQTVDINAIKLPEGMSASDEDKKNVLATAERLGINTQEGLQGFVDWLAEAVEKNQTETATAEEQSKKEWETIKAGWKTSLESDADFGKDYDANMERANKAMQQFGGSELSQWLKDSDLAGHPALIKAFARVGKEIEDAKIVTGNRTSQSSMVQRDRYNQPMIKYKD